MVRKTGVDFFAALPEASALLKGETPSEVAIAQIHPRPNQPRRYFDSESQAKLEHSIRVDGIIEPLILRPVEDGYEIVAGERRYRGAIAVGLQTVPAVIRELDNSQVELFALVENLQREDLNPIDEIDGIIAAIAHILEIDPSTVPSLIQTTWRLCRTGTISQYNHLAVASLFERLGVHLGNFVKNKLRLLNYPSEILEAIREGKIAYTKAALIKNVKDEGDRAQLLQNAIADQLSKREIQNRINALKDEPQAFSTTVRRMQKTISNAPPHLQQAIIDKLKEIEQLIQNDS